MKLPKDPVMLLSVVNTELRDHYPSLAELAKAYGVTEQLLILLFSLCLSFCL